MIMVHAEDLIRAKELLQHIPGGIQQATARAINRALDSGVTAASRKAREEYYVSHKAIITSVTFNRARTDKLIGAATSRGSKRELIEFRVNPNSAKRVPMVRVAVKKGSGMKEFPGAFVAAGTSSGNLHVLKRVGEKRYPLHVKYGPSVPEMIGAPNVKKFVEDRAREVLLVRLEHEIGRLLAKGAK